MGLRRITGQKRTVNLSADGREGVSAPSLAVYHPAQTFFRSLALGLLGITAIWSEETAGAIRQAAASIADDGSEGWSTEEARQVLAAVGTVSSPSHVVVEQVSEQPIFLIRAAKPSDPGAQRLNYRENSSPYLSLLAALRPAGIAIPRGMCMEVPVALSEDDDGLCLAAYFNRGKLRDATEEREDEVE